MGEFISNIQIEKVLPCVADASKIRVIARANKDIGEILPYLNSYLSEAIYLHSIKTLTFTLDESLITLTPNEVRLAQVRNEESAEKLLKWIQKTLNEVWERKNEIKPLFERRNELKPLDIYHYLPQLNCGKCGEGNCLAFALKLTQRVTSIMRCSPLFTPELVHKRKLLMELLRKTGYPTPNTF